MDKFSTRLDAILTSITHHGCAVDEISQLENEYQVCLPDDYRYFLKKCGRMLEGYLLGSDWQIEQLRDMQVTAQEVLSASNAIKMPANSFVFAMHQGYSFYYLSKEGVYLYSEGWKESERRFETFAAFLESTLRTRRVSL